MDIFESYNIEKEIKDKYIKLKLIQKNKVFNFLKLIFPVHVEETFFIEIIM